MTKCHHCGKEVAFPYRCNYCGGLFCDDCRLPPKHDCPNIAAWRSSSPPSRRYRTRDKHKRQTTKYTPTPNVRVRTKRKSEKKVKLASLLLMLALIPIIASQYISLPDILNINEPSELTERLQEPIAGTSKQVLGTIENITKQPTKDEIINTTIESVLKTLNSEREKHGLPPVKLMRTGIAQYRAQDMINRNYFGHYDPEGYPPFYYYTKMGGVHSMQENCGETEYFGGSVILTEIPKKAASHIRDMIYDDALSGWGHRDSLLDPANNYVDIGVDWDSDRVVLVVHMIGKHVEWKSPPKVENMVFSASGVLDKDVKFYGIGVYYHPPPEKVTNPTLRHSYELGSQIAGVVPVRTTMKISQHGGQFAGVYLQVSSTSLSKSIR